MKILYKILVLITLFADIHGHGFYELTYVRSYNYWQSIEQFSYESTRCKRVMTYDCATQKYLERNVVSMRKGTTNCVIKIGLDDSRANGIICTPSQEFYLPELDAWVEACCLDVGDKLLSLSHQHKSIVYVDFIDKPYNIYIMEVEAPHTFFVGSHSILTKNMILPCVAIGYAFPFGGGTAGGLLGGFLSGTFTCGLGCLVGGAVIGYTIKYCMTDREQSYDFTFDEAKLGLLFQEKSEPQLDGAIEIPVESPTPEKAHTEEPKVPRKTAEEVINSAQPWKETYKTKQYINPNGGESDANDDFDNLGLIDVTDKGDEVRTGKLPDGRTVVVRPTSSKKGESEGGFPTLEFQPRENVSPREQSIKIRYTKK